MIPTLQKFFALFKKPTPVKETIVETPICIQAEPEFSELQTTVIELMDKNQQVFLFKDTNGQKLQELKTLLERRGYFCYFLNTRDKVGPYNIFRHMTEDNYMEYVNILSLNNKSEMVKNLNALLLTAILLSMIEAEELETSEEVLIMRVEGEGDDAELVSIESDAELEAAFEEFVRRDNEEADAE